MVWQIPACHPPDQIIEPEETPPQSSRSNPTAQVTEPTKPGHFLPGYSPGVTMYPPGYQPGYGARFVNGHALQ